MEPEDYSEILNWFTISYGTYDFNKKKIPSQTRKTYWKLNFLAEDKIKEYHDMKG